MIALDKTSVTSFEYAVRNAHNPVSSCFWISKYLGTCLGYQWCAKHEENREQSPHFFNSRYPAG